MIKSRIFGLWDHTNYIICIAINSKVEDGPHVFWNYFEIRNRSKCLEISFYVLVNYQEWSEPLRTHAANYTKSWIPKSKNITLKKNMLIYLIIYYTSIIYISLPDLKSTEKPIISVKKNRPIFISVVLRRYWVDFHFFGVFWTALIMYFRILILFFDNSRLLCDNDRRSGIAADCGLVRSFINLVPGKSSVIYIQKFNIYIFASVSPKTSRWDR